MDQSCVITSGRKANGDPIPRSDIGLDQAAGDSPRFAAELLEREGPSFGAQGNALGRVRRMDVQPGLGFHGLRVSLPESHAAAA